MGQRSTSMLLPLLLLLLLLRQVRHALQVARPRLLARTWGCTCRALGQRPHPLQQQ